jgi:L-threonylcarbamoyladenylate synthase
VAKIPIAAPSANLFSHVSPTTAQHVIDDLDGKIDLILDGGVCPIGVESTVVDLISSPPVIRRPGGTPWEELVKYLPDILKRPDDEVTRDEPGLRSPGLYEKHYAPRAIFVLVQGEASLAIEMVMTLIKENLKRGAKIGILAYTEDLPGYAEFNVVKKDLGGEDHPEIVASRLYSAMRELDQENVDLIMARDIKQEGLGLAIHDRLVRAAAGKIVSTG